MTFSSALLWLARITLVFLVVASLLPLVRTGYWVVRLCDFPRLQLMALLLVPLVAALAHAWVTRSFRYEHGILIGAVLAIACFEATYTLPFTPLWPTEVAATTEPVNLRLMVANIEYENDRYDEVAQAIERQDPDVLLLIEFDDKWSEALQPLRKNYQHHIEVVRGEGLGLAMWSKLPVESEEVKYLVTERRPSIFAKLKLADGTLCELVGVHPTPPGLSDSTDGGRRDSRVRDAELVLVAKQVQAQSDTPWVVTGDFNDVAWSHTTRLFKRLSGLRDPRVGRKMLNTFHADYPPFRYPIDHVFLSEGSTVGIFERVRLPGSDHFGIVAEFHVAGEPAQDAATSDDHQEAQEVVEEGKEDAEERDIKADESDQAGGDREE